MKYFTKLQGRLAEMTTWDQAAYLAIAVLRMQNPDTSEKLRQQLQALWGSMDVADRARISNAIVVEAKHRRPQAWATMSLAAEQCINWASRDYQAGQSQQLTLPA